MLVNRRTFIAKKPRFEEALALLAEYRDLLKSIDSTAVMRVYAIEVGPFSTIACEYEVESLSAFERALAEFQEHPKVKPRLTSLVRAVASDYCARWHKRVLAPARLGPDDRPAMSSESVR